MKIKNKSVFPLATYGRTSGVGFEMASQGCSNTFKVQGAFEQKDLPVLTANDAGTFAYCTTLKEYLVWDGENWLDQDNNLVLAEPRYLTLTCSGGKTNVTLYLPGTVEESGQNFNIEVSYNGGDWRYPLHGEDVIYTLNDGQTLRFRGRNNVLNSDSGYCMSIKCTHWYNEDIGEYDETGFIDASGDVTSLLNGMGADVKLPAYAFYELFKDGDGSENCLRTAPNLPSTTLAPSCYSNMFEGCTSLTTAPTKLPATTLVGSCYYGMFYGCTSLTTAPELPGTTLAPYCYQNMFQGCTSLTTAPALPVTTLADSCYYGMFYGCTSLTTAPELPTTTLAPSCYANMFYGCTSLTTAPALPATTLVDSCYTSMFQGCTSLTTVPALPATTLAQSCCAYMFSGCASLQNVTVGFDTFENFAKNETNYWLDAVSETGTFTWPGSSTYDNRGSDTIPEGWTIVSAANE